MMKKFLFGTAIALVLASASYAQDANTPVDPNGQGQPQNSDQSDLNSTTPANPQTLPPVTATGLILACVNGVWTYLQYNSDGTVSGYQQYNYDNVDPSDPNSEPTPDTCDPGNDGQTVTENPLTQPVSGGEVVDGPPPPPPPPPGSGNAATPPKGMSKQNGPGGTIILITPKGEIIIHAPPGTVFKLPWGDIYVVTPDGPQPVVVVDPNDPSKRAIYTPGGKAVGVDPTGHVGKGPDGRTVEIPSGADKLSLPQRSAGKTRDFKSIGHTEKSNTKPIGASEHSNAKLGGTIEHANARSEDRPKHAMRTVAHEKSEVSHQVAHMTEAGHTRGMHEVGKNMGSVGAVHGGDFGGRGKMGGAHLGNLGGMLLGGLGRL
jgi:hypothetical protein